MKSQQHGHLNKTYMMAIPVDRPICIGISHKAPSLDREPQSLRAAKKREERGKVILFRDEPLIRSIELSD